MASIARSLAICRPWRFSRRDGILVGFAALHVAALIAWPSIVLIALGIWWNSNTIAHNFIHRPFFRSRVINRLFSACQSVLLGIPQTLWRERHLAHHASVEWRLRISAALVIETLLVIAFWIALGIHNPRFFFGTYLPGYAAGLLLCFLQGYWEHARDEPVSHYGFLYNFLCFNDGHHAEHHANPALHWSTLPSYADASARHSPWPPLLRWLDSTPLELLEHAVLRHPRLQRFVLLRHRHAMRRLLAAIPEPREITIIGGALYPRTALILRELLPNARLIILDSNRSHLKIARAFLPEGVEYRHENFQTGQTFRSDLTVIPLCLIGDRAGIYRHPPSAFVLLHDWIWHRRGMSVVVSPLLLKRLNLVRR
jgi:hypothetical protein